MILYTPVISEEASLFASVRARCGELLVVLDFIAGNVISKNLAISKSLIKYVWQMYLV